MKLIKQLASAVAVVAVGVGVVATSADAYGFTGGPNLTGTASAQHTLVVGGAYTVDCDTSFTGVAGTSLSFNFNHTNCTFFGLPADVTTVGSWVFSPTGGSAPNFTGQITIPSTTTTTVSVPAAGCEVYVGTPQTFSHGVGGTSITATNIASPTSVELDAVLTNIAYTTNGMCPFGSGTGEYYTNGPVTINGLTIDN